MFAILVIPLYWSLNWLTRGRLLEVTALNPLICLLLLMVVVSLFSTFDLQFSLNKVSGVLLGAFVFWGLNQFIQSERRLRLSIAGFFAGGIVLSIVAILGTAWWAKFPIMSRIVAFFPTRLRGLPGAEEGFNPNAVGGAIVLVLPLVVALIMFQVRQRRDGESQPTISIIVLTFVLIVIGGILLLSQSRGAWMAFVGAAILLMVQNGGRLRLAAIYASAAVLLAALYFILWRDFSGGLGAGLMVGGETTLSARVEIWTRAIYGIQDFPFTGMGMNGFRKVIHVLYPLFVLAPGTDIAHAHNQFLQVALDLGIPGLVAYSALLAATIVMGVRIWMRSGIGWVRAAAQGLVSGILAQQVFGITDAIALGSKVGIFWWIALGLIAGMYRLTFSSRTPL